MLLAAALVAGCAGDRGAAVAENPRGAVENALDQLPSYEGIEATVRLDSDVPSLQAAFAEDDLTEEQAGWILDSSVRWAQHFADTDEPSDDRILLEARAAGVTAFELRVRTPEEIYVRADVEGLLERFDTSGEGREQLPAMIEEAEANGIDFLDDAAAGRWLHLQGAQQVLRALEGLSGGDVGEPGVDDELEARLSERLSRLVDEHGEFRYVGSEEAGEHVRFTVSGGPLREFTTDVLATLREVALGQQRAQIDALLQAIRTSDSTTFDQVRIPAELWLEDGRLAQLGFDLVHFATLNPALSEEDDGLPGGVGRMQLVVGLSEFTSGIDAPADAVEVDLFRLLGRVVGGGFGAGGVAA